VSHEMLNNVKSNEDKMRGEPTNKGEISAKF